MLFTPYGGIRPCLQSHAAAAAYLAKPKSASRRFRDLLLPAISQPIIGQKTSDGTNHSKLAKFPIPR